jgi:hypothetical protein
LMQRQRNLSPHSSLDVKVSVAAIPLHHQQRCRRNAYKCLGDTPLRLFSSGRLNLPAESSAHNFNRRSRSAQANTMPGTQRLVSFTMHLVLVSGPEPSGFGPAALSWGSAVAYSNSRRDFRNSQQSLEDLSGALQWPGRGKFVRKECRTMYLPMSGSFVAVLSPRLWPRRPGVQGVLPSYWADEPARIDRRRRYGFSNSASPPGGMIAEICMSARAGTST